MGFELQWERYGVVKRYFGDVTADELVQPVLLTHADARFDELRYVINDCLDVASVRVDGDATKDVVEEIAIHDKGASATNPRIRVAIVATEPSLVALAKAYIASPLNTFPTRIFATMRDARAWLAPEATQP